MSPTSHPATAPTPFRLFQRQLDPSLKDLLDSLDEKDPEELEDKGPVLCRFCMQPITHIRNRTTVNGSHMHRFTNPSGLPFHIALFSQAKGCINLGAPTLKFTWFAG